MTATCSLLQKQFLCIWRLYPEYQEWMDKTTVELIEKINFENYTVSFSTSTLR